MQQGLKIMKTWKPLTLVLIVTGSASLLIGESNGSAGTEETKEPFTTFEASASARLATHLLQLEIDENRTISKMVKGFSVSGNQHTQGPARITFHPSHDHADLQINFDLETTSKMLATAHVGRTGLGGHRIYIEIDSSATTNLIAAKPFQFTSEKFSSFDSQCSAKTFLALDAVRASAPGITMLGRRIKSNVATKKTIAEFYRSKTEQEENMSHEIAQVSCDRIDHQTNEFIGNLYTDFRQIFFDPMFQQNSTQNALKLWTGADQIFATAKTGQTDRHRLYASSEVREQRPFDFDAPEFFKRK